ncbi:MAG: putative anti-sigma regulatory factor, serine/threonine protein kinase [Solirubrobacterales bacterium]|nr:putative anti-sigma regulatory factor, serine/threonine protein kinase [Solirubrobacterales bacterium]
MSSLRTAYVARPSAPGLARQDVRAWAAFLPDEASIDLVIAVNELVTNSVRHGPDRGLVRLGITLLTEDMLFVEVYDEGACPSAARTPEAGTGRGLRMVSCLAADWGVSDDPKRTWFTLATSARAAGSELHTGRGRSV